jgi:DNA helicase-2/ATP-dependent DNA helicase PcrA
MIDFHTRLTTGLNPEQHEVVLHDKGPLLVVAVAGAGKTHALVNRCGYLVRVRKVDPSRILAVTFSKAGADEMQERLDSLIGKSGARIGTFHSLALEILFAENPEYRDWTIDDRDRYRLCLKDATSYKEMDWKEADATLLSAYTGLCKANLARPDSDIAAGIADGFYARLRKPAAHPGLMRQAYARAEEIRQSRLLLTFDDMLMNAVEKLRDDNDARVRWASRYDYVLQDEAQDQNLAQLLMGELLAQDHRNYMLVGDPAQAIYGFRGAKPEKLLAFQNTWDSKVVLMGRNYRCGESIIDVANAALDAMRPDTRLDVKMIAERREDGAPVPGTVSCKQYTTTDDEGFGIVDQIQAMMEDGVLPRDFAVLYRVNAQSRSPEEALITARLPYRVIGGVSFYERKEVKNLLAYLRLANGTGALDDVGRCINTPFRYLGKAFIEKVRAEAERAGVMSGADRNWTKVIRTVADKEGIQSRQRSSANDWASIVDTMAARIARGVNAEPNSVPYDEALPASILERIVLQTRYAEALLKEEGEESTENSRVSNVREMIRAAGRFNSVSDLLDYVDKMIKASKESSKEKSPNKVTLCTLHRAKGLEWPVVFIAGVSDLVLPHGRAEEPDEERRLYYVGVTRARDTLHVSCVRTLAFGGKLREVDPSPFLAESGLRPTIVDHVPRSDTKHDDLDGDDGFEFDEGENY